MRRAARPSGAAPAVSPTNHPHLPDLPTYIGTNPSLTFGLNIASLGVSYFQAEHPPTTTTTPTQPHSISKGQEWHFKALTATSLLTGLETCR